MNTKGGNPRGQPQAPRPAAVWLQLTWLTALALASGLAVAEGLRSLLSPLLTPIMLCCIYGAETGILVGAAQWIVIRRIQPKLRWWPIATAVAATIAFTLVEPSVSVTRLVISSLTAHYAYWPEYQQAYSSGLGEGAIVGLALGIGQFLVMKDKVSKPFFSVPESLLAWLLVGAFKSSMSLSLASPTLAATATVCVAASVPTLAITSRISQRSWTEEAPILVASQHLPIGWPDLRFAAYWVLAALGGLFVARSVGGMITSHLLAALAMGTVVGIAQWLVIRSRIPRLAAWIPATAVAYVAVYPQVIGLGGTLLGLPSGMLMGLCIGGIQSLVLRTQLTAAGWYAALRILELGLLEAWYLAVAGQFDTFLLFLITYLFAFLPLDALTGVLMAIMLPPSR